jgi:hypothetical protein
MQYIPLSASRCGQTERHKRHSDTTIEIIEEFQSQATQSDTKSAQSDSRG